MVYTKPKQINIVFFMSIHAVRLVVQFCVGMTSVRPVEPHRHGNLTDGRAYTHTL